MRNDAEAVMAISDKLNRIQKRAKVLNEKTDAFNATIELIEKGLAGCGVEYWWGDGYLFQLTMWRGDSGPQRSYHVLGYAKVGGEWCLAMREHDEFAYTNDADGAPDWETDEVGAPVALRRASRALRIEAAPQLEKFLDALYEAIGAMEAKVDKATEIIADDAAADPELVRIIDQKEREEQRKGRKS